MLSTPGSKSRSISRGATTRPPKHVPNAQTAHQNQIAKGLVRAHQVSNCRLKMQKVSGGPYIAPIFRPQIEPGRRHA
jgi:hypothetical protein